MFILWARPVPSNLLKVEMIIYIWKWNVCPDRSQGNKIIIAFRETDTVHLLEGEKSKYVLTQMSSNLVWLWRRWWWFPLGYHFRFAWYGMQTDLLSTINEVSFAYLREEAWWKGFQCAVGSAPLSPDVSIRTFYDTAWCLQPAMLLGDGRKRHGVIVER